MGSGGGGAEGGMGEGRCAAAGAAGCGMVTEVETSVVPEEEGAWTEIELGAFGYGVGAMVSSPRSAPRGSVSSPRAGAEPSFPSTPGSL